MSRTPTLDFTKQGSSSAAPEEWISAKLKATLTISTELSAVSASGHFHQIQDIQDLMSLEIPELVQNGSHIPNRGGDLMMMKSSGYLKNVVADKLEKDVNVQSVLYSPGKEDTYYVIIHEDDVDIEMRIFDEYWNIKDSYPEYEFEFRIYSREDFETNYDQSKLDTIFRR